LRLPIFDKPGRVEYSSIEEALGAADGRFFGSGYRKVSHHLRFLGCETTVPGSWHASGTADVCYPGDWSRKSGASELRPHLSSIDAVALAVRLAEQGLAQALSLDQEQRRRMWLRSVTFRAAAEPLMSLADFGVRAAAVRSAPEPFSLCGHASSVECRVGPVKIILEIEHEPGRPGGPGFLQSQRLTVKNSEESSGGYFDGGYKDTACEIGPVSADLETGTAQAVVKVSEPVTGACQDGIGAAYHPCLMIIDGIVVVAQLAQVLAYAADSLRRDQTNTLWLRSFSCSLQTPYQAIANPFIASVSTSKSRIIPFGGNQWRTLNLKGNAIGFAGSFSVAHQIPGGGR
jgi:hypothetical protein